MSSFTKLAFQVQVVFKVFKGAVLASVTLHLNSTISKYIINGT